LRDPGHAPFTKTFSGVMLGLTQMTLADACQIWSSYL